MNGMPRTAARGGGTIDQFDTANRTVKRAEVLPAEVASADIFDVLLDAAGSLWVRTAVYDPGSDQYGRLWAYVTEDGVTDCDARSALPDVYGPYTALDPVSAAIVLRGIRC